MLDTLKGEILNCRKQVSINKYISCINTSISRAINNTCFYFRMTEIKILKNFVYAENFKKF